MALLTLNCPSGVVYALWAIEDLPHFHVEGGDLRVLIFFGLILGTVLGIVSGVYFILGRLLGDVKQDTKFVISLAMSAVLLFVFWTPLIEFLRWLTPWAGLGMALFFVLGILGGIISMFF